MLRFKNRRAWLAGIWLMFLLGMFSPKTSPPEKPAPTFPTVVNYWAPSGSVSAQTVGMGMTTTTPTFPIVHPSIMLDVYPPITAEVLLLRTEVTVMMPPIWASDEVRGIRKRFRG